MNEPLVMQLYLGGDIDANMLRLRHATEDMVEEINLVASERISVELYDPNEAESDEARYANYQRLEMMGLRGMSVTVRDRGGRLSEQVIFPWARLCGARDTMDICLMQPGTPLQGEAMVNAAIEDLEYKIVDAIRVLNRSEVRKIAFIEGHGELPEEEVYAASEALSRYFQIDRGVIGPDPSVLDPYAAIIIAKPTEPFSEADKFVIDQYIMRGGRVFWLLDGARVSNEHLSEGGLSPLIPYELNLNDMLFRYGVRLTPTIIEDMQCAYMPVNMARVGEPARFEPVPWYYNPLLQTSPYNPVTKNMVAVRADFASGLEVVGDTVDVHKEFLLLSGNASHATFAPGEIDVQNAVRLEPENYFNRAYIPIAMLAEGSFTSVFQNRMVPDSVYAASITTKSVDTKMIVVGDGDVIRNDIQVEGQQMYVVPLGFDRVTQQTHGNADFVVRSMLYLTDSEGVMNLRSKQVPLRLLNRAVIEAHRTEWIYINVLIPVALLAVFGASFLFYRRRKYRKL